MKRQLIALIVMLAIGLQGSLAAFAAVTPWMQPDCQTATEMIGSDASPKPCCPSGSHMLSCCLDVCVSTTAVPTAPQALIWYGRTTLDLNFPTATFSSRDDSPLTRPPIF